MSENKSDNAQADSKTRSIEEALSEVDRECKVRERCYTRWVEDGKLSSIDARDRYERLDAARKYLKHLLALEEEGKLPF